MITLKKISKSYRHKVLLESFDYSFPPKGLFKICGPNGVGKTTLLKIVGGHASYRGKIIEDGVRLHQLQARREFSSSLVYRNFLKLHRTSTIEEALCIVDSIDCAQLTVCHAILKELKLETALGEKIESLSEGEFNRLVSAIALSRQSQVFLLDEPLSSLDRRTALKVKSLMDRQSATALVIYSSHDDLPLKAEESVITLGAEQTAKNNADQPLSARANAPKPQAAKARQYIKKNAHHEVFLSSCALALSIATGAVGSLLFPTVLDYADPPSSISQAVDADYGFLDFEDYYQKPFFDTVYHELIKKKVDFSPVSFVNKVTFDEKSVDIADLVALPTSYSNMMLSSDFFKTTVPRGKFYLTSALAELIEKSPLLYNFGTKKNPLESLKVGGLSYGGKLASPQHAFIVSPNDVASYERLCDAVNDSVFDQRLYRPDGQPLNRQLAIGEAAVYFDPASGGVLPSFVYVEDKQLEVVGYHQEKVLTTVISSEFDLQTTYIDNCKLLYPYGLSTEFNIYIKLSTRDRSSYADLARSLRKEVISKYRDSQSAPMLIGLLSTVICLGLTLIYTAFYTVYSHHETRQYHEQLQMLGHRSYSLELTRLLALPAACLIGGLLAFVYAVLVPLASYSAIDLLLIFFPFTILATASLALSFCFAKHPLESSASEARNE